MRKKISFSMLTALVALISCFLFASCEKDKDKNKNHLSGTWEWKNTNSLGEERESWLFYSDGTGSYYSSYPYQKTQGTKYTYTVTLHHQFNGKFDYTESKAGDNIKSGYVKIVFKSVNGDEGYGFKKGTTYSWFYSITGDVLLLNGKTYTKN